ncbi:hypothetical protein CDL12_24751 [Handroanthus impetiginosus]|uniref:Uncharacterized protein n=1 Tax=Handroanthus impetiginosus TaxID=429701 RepID=A0A2G9GBR3_9LAMI|nr:hypothetical protein CDL12_24751 [Handroanthus impetiginosus]
MRVILMNISFYFLSFLPPKISTPPATTIVAAPPPARSLLPCSQSYSRSDASTTTVAICHCHCCPWRCVSTKRFAMATLGESQMGYQGLGFEIGSGWGNVWDIK